MRSPVKYGVRHPEGEATHPLVELLLYFVLVAGGLGVVYGLVRVVCCLARWIAS